MGKAIFDKLEIGTDFRLERKGGWITAYINSESPWCFVRGYTHRSEEIAIPLQSTIKLAARGHVENECYGVRVSEIFLNDCVSLEVRWDVVSGKEYNDVVIEAVAPFSHACRLLDVFIGIMNYYGKDEAISDDARKHYIEVVGEEAFNKLEEFVKKYWERS